MAGFGDPVVIFIATLFVVSEGIDSTGVTTWAGQALLGRAGTGHARVLVAVCLLSALLASSSPSTARSPRCSRWSSCWRSGSGGRRPSC